MTSSKTTNAPPAAMPLTELSKIMLVVSLVFPLRMAARAFQRRAPEADSVRDLIAWWLPTSQHCAPLVKWARFGGELPLTYESSGQSRMVAHVAT